MRHQSFSDLTYPYPEGKTVVSPKSRTEVYVTELGDPESQLAPIVLLHPWGFNMLAFAELAPMLAKEHRVILIDLPGHGKTSKPPGRYPPLRHALAVLDVLDSKSIDRAIFIGNSMGGAAAVEIARIAPNRAEQLFLIGTPGGRALPEFYLRGIRSFVSADNVSSVSELGWRVGYFFFAPSAPLADRTLEDTLSLRGSAEWSDWSAAVSAALFDVATYQAPRRRIEHSVVIQGRGDPVVSKTSATELAKKLGSELVFLDGCGHLPEVECPEQLLGVLEDRLGRNLH